MYESPVFAVLAVTVTTGNPLSTERAKNQSGRMRPDADTILGPHHERGSGLVSQAERELDPDLSALHSFGFELRKWRKTRGFSQDRLGKVVLASGDLLRRIETGDRRPARDLVLRCEGVLRTGGKLLEAWEEYIKESERDRAEKKDADTGTVRPDSPASRIAEAAPESEMITVMMISLTGEHIPMKMDRRAFVGGAVALPLVGWVGQGFPQISANVPDGDLADIVSEMMSLRIVLARQDNVLGSGVAAPTVIHQLTVLDKLGQGAKGATRESVKRVQAAYAEFGGWLSDELGDRRAGQYWTDRSLEWALEADDEPTVGYILARKAQRAIEVSDARSAISLACAAQRRGALPPRVRAAALQYEAIGHAASGEVDEFRASIDQARELVESAAASSEVDWAFWCTPGYVTMYEAAGWEKLRDFARAVAAYERGLDGWPNEFRRDEGVYRARLACAYAGDGNPEIAVNVGRKALDIAARTGSARILAELGPLLVTLAPVRHIPAVQHFNADLRVAIRRTGHKGVT